MQNFIAFTNEDCVFAMTARTSCFYIVDRVSPVSMLFSIWLERPLTISSYSKLPSITESVFDSAMAADRRSNDSELCSCVLQGLAVYVNLT